MPLPARSKNKTELEGDVMAAIANLREAALEYAEADGGFGIFEAVSLRALKLAATELHLAEKILSEYKESYELTMDKADAVAAIVRNWEKVKAEISRYPLEVENHTFRKVFANLAELKAFLSENDIHPEEKETCDVCGHSPPLDCDC